MPGINKKKKMTIRMYSIQVSMVHYYLGYINASNANVNPVITAIKGVNC